MPVDKRRWTTPVQHDFLLERFPGYLEAQAKARYDQFWPKFFQEWFAKFPTPEPEPGDPTDSEPEPETDSEAESENPAQSSGKRKRRATKNAKKKRAKNAVPAFPLTLEEKISKKKGRTIRAIQQRLKAFFRWHVTPTKNPRKKAAISSGASAFGQLSSTKPNRRLQETEVYSKMYYKDRILPILRLRLAADPAPKGRMIQLIRELTKEIYDEEDAETKAEVAAKVAEQVSHVGGDDEGGVEERTPQQYQDAIDELPAYLEGVVRLIERSTGLSGTFIVGGPMPAMNGALSTISVHLGKNELGNTFGQAFKDYGTAVVQPFQHFLRNVYPTATRQSRALNLPVTTAPVLLEGLDTIELDPKFLEDDPAAIVTDDIELLTNIISNPSTPTRPTAAPLGPLLHLSSSLFVNAPEDPLSSFAEPNMGIVPAPAPPSSLPSSSPPPSISTPLPKPRPSYKAALEARAAAEAAAAAEATATEPRAVAEAKAAAEAVASAEARAAADKATSRSSSPSSLSPPPPALPQEDQGRGRRARKMTDLGEIHAREVAEKQEKAATKHGAAKRKLATRKKPVRKEKGK